MPSRDFGSWFQRHAAKHAMLAPAFAFFAAFTIFPLCFTVYVSLNIWNVGGNHVFVGLGNYHDILTDLTYLLSLRNTVMFALATTLIEYVLGFAVAHMVHGVTRCQRPIRLIVLLPMLLTPIVVGFIWKMMLDPTYGPVDDVLAHLGLPRVNWLSSPVPAFIGIIIADTWEWTPFMFLILFAGLRSLPAEPFESARVDGASPWRIFWDLTFPLMIPASVAAVLLRSVESFKLFDIVYLITAGGPGVATSTVSLDAYFTGLRAGDLGTAAAMTIVLLAIVVVVTLVFLQAVVRFTRSRPPQQDPPAPAASSIGHMGAAHGTR
jgi:multiple sugar transport system permease protein